MQNRETDSFASFQNGRGYDAFGRSNSIGGLQVANSPKRVIYCVHGKPSAGCCTVLEGEVIDVDAAEVDISSHAKENSKTTNLINKHCHKTRSEDVDKKAKRKLILASVLCVIFMIGEALGGYLSSSLAIATDAAHLLTDFASFMISLFSLWVATRPATKKMSFGWYRAEVIGALTSVLMIWVVTGVLVYLAVQRVIDRDFEIDAKVMLITSAVGVAVNLIIGSTVTLCSSGVLGFLNKYVWKTVTVIPIKFALKFLKRLTKQPPSYSVCRFHSSPKRFAFVFVYSMGLTLHQHGHSHGSGKGHNHNINVRAAFIHVIGDFLQSFGVFVAALFIYFKPEWNIIDPICTFVFSVLVLLTTVSILKEALLVLMEGMPKGVDFNDVMNIFLNIEGVKRVHNLRIWALSLDKIALSAHIAIGAGVNPQSILMVATKSVHDKYNFFEMTLQIEEFQDVMEDCYQCKIPAK